MDYREFTNPVLEKVEADIERVGWSAIGVFPTEDDDPVEARQFTYSIGFHDKGHPEMIVFGLSMEMSHSILWDLWKRVEAGERFEDGKRYDEVLEGYQVEMRALPPDGRPLFVARAHYQVDELEALQVVWPDMEGKFPGEEGCDWLYERAQDIEPTRRVD